jgi:cysteine-rich repeat protein
MEVSGTVSGIDTAAATFNCANAYFGTMTFTRRPPAPPACGNRVVEPGEDCDDGNAGACDGCTSCHLDQCGDSVVCANSGEQCDDGNASGSDGCDPQCQLEPLTVTGSLGASGTLTTDTGGSGATPSQPLQAAVTTPTGGDVTITRSGGTAPLPGFSLLTGLVQISAPPAASPTTPLALTFLVDASLVPPGENQNTIQVTKDGVSVPDCTGTTGEAVPDPCVSERLLLTGSDVQITVLTTSASEWGLAVSVCTAVPAQGCRKALKAPLLIKKGKTDAIVWRWRGGFTTLADFGDPIGQTDYVLCVYDQHGGVPDRRLAMVTSHGGTCSGLPCWRQTSTGFQFKSNALPPDGRLRWKLQTPRRGPANIVISGKGSALGVPPLPLDQSPAVIVQLRSSSGTCWEARYGTHVANTSGKFKAQAD